MDFQVPSQKHFLVAVQNYLRNYQNEVSEELECLYNETGVFVYRLQALEFRGFAWMLSRKVEFEWQRNNTLSLIIRNPMLLSKGKRLAEILALPCEVTEDLPRAQEWMLELYLRSVVKRDPETAARLGLVEGSSFKVHIKEGVVIFRRSTCGASEVGEHTEEIRGTLEGSIKGTTLAEVAWSMRRIHDEAIELLNNAKDRPEFWVAVPTIQLEKERFEAEKGEARALVRRALEVLELESSEQDLLQKHPEVVAEVLAEARAA
jgi:hypothetical protein